MVLRMMFIVAFSSPQLEKRVHVVVLTRVGAAAACHVAYTQTVVQQYSRYIFYEWFDLPPGRKIFSVLLIQ